MGLHDLRGRIKRPSRDEKARFGAHMGRISDHQNFWLMT